MQKYLVNESSDSSIWNALYWHINLMSVYFPVIIYQYTAGCSIGIPGPPYTTDIPMSTPRFLKSDLYSVQEKWLITIHACKCQGNEISCFHIHYSFGNLLRNANIPCTGSTFIKFTKTATKCVANFKSNYRHPPCNIKLTTRRPEDGPVVGDSVPLGDPGQVGERGAFPMLKKCNFFLSQPSLHQSSLF